MTDFDRAAAVLPSAASPSVDLTALPLHRLEAALGRLEALHARRASLRAARPAPPAALSYGSAAAAARLKGQARQLRTHFAALDRHWARVGELVERSEEAARGPGADPCPMVRAGRGGREALEQVTRFCAGLQGWVDEEWTDVLNELSHVDRVGGVEDVERVVKLLSRALDEMAGAREEMKRLEALHASVGNPAKISSGNEFSDT